MIKFIHVALNCNFIKLSALVISCFVLTYSLTPLRAETYIQTNATPDNEDFRNRYPGIVLSEALDITKAKYGSYKLLPSDPKLSRNRSLKELIIGHIQVFSTATRKNWEEQAIPIRIPIRKGIQGYKLLLIHEHNKAKFSTFKNVEDLKTMILGGGSQWTSSKAFKQLGFTVVGGTKYDNLFKMFQHNRFDFFPRNPNNIVKELSLYKATIPTMIIEPTLALYLPNPVYFFVSKNSPELASRIKIGLNKLIENGRFNELFIAHHKLGIEQADFQTRRILHLENPFLTPQTPYSRKELWYKPSQN